MAVANSIQTIYAGLGNPTVYGSSQGNAATTAGSPQTFTITFTTPQVIRSGMYRGRFSGTTNTPTTAFRLTGSDGTNTVTLVQTTVTLAIGANAESEFEGFFISERNLTSVSFITTLTGASGTATFDAEIAGNP